MPRTCHSRAALTADQVRRKGGISCNAQGFVLRPIATLALAAAVFVGWAWTEAAAQATGAPAGQVFGEHFLDSRARGWNTVTRHGTQSGLTFQSGEQAGMHFVPQADAVAYRPWKIGAEPFDFTAELEMTAGWARGWGRAGAALAVLSAPPDEMGEDDLALAFTIAQEGVGATIRRGGFFQPDDEGRNYRDRGLAPRYVLNYSGGGGHDHSVRWPGSDLAGLRVRIQITRRADNTIHFAAYLRDGLSPMPWWEGDYPLPEELADAEFQGVAVRPLLSPGDFTRIRNGETLPYEIRGRFLRFQGRPLAGPPTPAVDSYRAEQLPLKPGEAITVSGRHFDRKAQVLIGGHSAAKTTFVTARELLAELPERPELVAQRRCALAVVNGNGLAGRYAHGLLYGSVLERVEPREAMPSGGDVVTIHGGGFDPHTRFTIGGKPAPVVELLDSGRVRVKVPPGEPGLALVAATSGDRSFTGDPAFGYAPHPYMWFRGREGLEDLRRKFREPMFEDYRKLILALPKKEPVEVRRFGPEVAELPSALRTPRGEERVPAAWYDEHYFDLDVTIRDNHPHQVALYCFDYFAERWPGPRLKVELLTPDSTRVLDARRLWLIEDRGEYLVWNIQGDVKIRVRGGHEYGAVAAGLFFDAVPPGTRSPRDTAEFVKLDPETRGEWLGVYGGDGYTIAGGESRLPGYAEVRLNSIVSRELAIKRGPAQPIYTNLWLYLLTGEAEYREPLMQFVDWAVTGDCWGYTPAECNGFPGIRRRAVDVGDFYGHTVEAVAAVYDALFPELSAEDRARIGRWLDHTMRYAAGRIRANDWWYANNPSNTIAVGSSCLGLNVLALKHGTPDADDLIDLAVDNIRHKYRGIAADGGCVEGTLYWNYALTHQVMFGEALRNTTGDDRGLLTGEKMRRAHRFVETSLGGDGTMFPFNDSQPWLTGPAVCASLGEEHQQPLLLWTADRIMADAASGEVPSAGETLGPRTLVPAFLFRHRTPAPRHFPGVPTLTHLEETNWGAMRSDGSAFRPNLVVGVKGKGGPVTHHINPDLGGFVLYAFGENLILDPGYFQSAETEENALLVDGKGPDRKNGVATIVDTWEDSGRRAMAVDLARAYEKPLARARRHFVMDGDRSLVILDEMPGGRVTLQLQCAFEPQLDDDRAGFRLSGKSSRMAVRTFGPHVELGAEPREWEHDWVYTSRGHARWYTISGPYAASASEPTVTVFTPTRGTAEPPKSAVKRSGNEITVLVGSRPAARFMKKQDGWQAVTE